MLLVVYGTLRKGEALSEYMEFCALKYEHTVETIELKGIAIYILGDVPGAKIDSKSSAVVELWELVGEEKSLGYTLDMLDQIEGVPQGLYKRSYVYTSRGEALIYTYCGSVKGTKRIKDWKEWVASGAKAEGPIILTNGRG